jgi:hypothetical protein
MASELTPTYDSDSGQVVLEGLPPGAAGGAGLIPVPGLELEFDRADGRLSRVVVDVGPPHGKELLTAAAATALSGLLGRRAPTAVRDAAAGRREAYPLCADERHLAPWSRLARLESARATSPVPASPAWSAEAAQLAAQAGLHAWSRAAAKLAAGGLADLLSQGSIPQPLVPTALAIADIVEPDQPDAARQLRDYTEKSPVIPLKHWLAEQGAELPSVTAARAYSLDSAQTAWLQPSLDPEVGPGGVLVFGLTPSSDLIVHVESGQDRVIVEALLAPQTVPRRDRGNVSRCLARLVAPSSHRRTIALAPFEQDGLRARAVLTLPVPINELKGTWVEVVDDENRPVLSDRLHRIRRALRWADAALRAEQQPLGVAPCFTSQEWTALATAAWECCACDWEDAGDADRAFLAARRLTIRNRTARAPAAPSTWSAALANRYPLRETAFLAEAIGR